jgi:luciferase family oxidoreductase group 1
MGYSSKRIRLSILDFGLRATAEESSRAILVSTSKMAVLADRLGYSRYWVSEHQSRYGAWGNPTPLVAHLASKTRDISVGPAGVLAAFCDPFRLAEDFRLLECLYPGRIDLGLARAEPAQPALKAHLTDREALDRAYERSTEDIVRLIRTRHDSTTIEAEALVPIPWDVTLATPWMLGSGTRSRDTALRLRTAFCYSLFHCPGTERTPAVLREYLDRFEPDVHCREPRAALAVCVICAETEREAQVIEVQKRPQASRHRLTVNVLGDASHCAEQLHELAHSYAVDELVLLDLSRDAAERERCFTLLASSVLDSR